MTINKISLGLDIGVSSVGYSVLDYENGKILELGSHLFSASDAEKNATRRGSRSSRRLLRRKRQRRIDAVRLFQKVGLIATINADQEANEYYQPFATNANPYELRVRGLNEQLTKIELATALYQLVKHRGISFSLADEANKDGGSDYAKSLQVNEQAIANRTPAQIQLDRLHKYGQVRGQINDVEQDEVLLNVFPTKAFLSEAKEIIAQQRQYYPDILNADFEEQYCAILTRKRDYFVGPGNEKSRTDYGIYKENGETIDNLFEELIGHDKVFPEELRASAASYTAQEFNVLNDLNNLTIATYEDGKLTPDDKQKILNELRNSTKNIQIMKVIKKVAQCDDEDIRGYRKNSKDKPDINSLAIYRKVHRDFLKQDVDVSEWSRDFLDDLSFILTLNTEDGEIRKQIEQRLVPKYDFLNDDLIQIILDNRQSFAISTNNKWHRFSIKTMKMLRDALLNTSKEQIGLLYEMGYQPQDDLNYQDYKYLPYKQITKDIYNPVVAKSVRESLKIVNAILKKYNTIDYLVVEMPRDDNEADAKKKIEKFQKNNKEQKDQALNTFIEEVGSKQLVDDAVRSNGVKFYTAIRLWYTQKGYCFYSGKYIEPLDLLNNFGNFEIDHIIPQSVSFDDSLNNKTLCYKSMNQQKKKQTPYGFLQQGNGQGWDKFRAMVLADQRLNKHQRENLLFIEDLEDLEVRKRFIARNLVDTRYASRIVLNSLQQFFKAHDKGTRVTVIRGKFTSNMRKHWKLADKSRETHHHHAIDASIIAATPFLNLWKKQRTIFPKKVGETTIDITTGEIIDNKEYEKETFGLPYNHIVEDLDKIDGEIKFSHQVDKKMNRRMSKDTIYSVRPGQLSKDEEPVDYLISKTADIHTVNGYQDFIKVYKKDKSKFLMAHLDPRTFEQIERILQDYPDQKEYTDKSDKVKTKKVSPFALYQRDHGPVRKYSKKNNGPIIKQMKYYDKRLGQGIDITPANARNKKTVLLSLIPWRTDIYYNTVTQEYEIMGIRQSDLSTIDGGILGVKKTKYLELKHKENVSAESEFRFSLYRKNRFKVQNEMTGESYEALFWSRANRPLSAEIKPLDASVYVAGETVPIYKNANNSGRIVQHLIPKNCKIWKVNTDILGNPYYIEKESENPQNILD